MIALAEGSAGLALVMGLVLLWAWRIETASVVLAVQSSAVGLAAVLLHRPLMALPPLLFASLLLSGAMLSHRWATAHTFAWLLKPTPNVPPGKVSPGVVAAGIVTLLSLSQRGLGLPLAIVLLGTLVAATRRHPPLQVLALIATQNGLVLTGCLVPEPALLSPVMLPAVCLLLPLPLAAHLLIPPKARLRTNAVPGFAQSDVALAGAMFAATLIIPLDGIASVFAPLLGLDAIVRSCIRRKRPGLAPTLRTFALLQSSFVLLAVCAPSMIIAWLAILGSMASVVLPRLRIGMRREEPLSLPADPSQPGLQMGGTTPLLAMTASPNAYRLTAVTRETPVLMPAMKNASAVLVASREVAPADSARGHAAVPPGRWPITAAIEKARLAVADFSDRHSPGNTIAKQPPLSDRQSLPAAMTLRLAPPTALSHDQEPDATATFDTTPGATDRPHPAVSAYDNPSPVRPPSVRTARCWDEAVVAFTGAGLALFGLLILSSLPSVLGYFSLFAGFAIIGAIVPDLAVVLVILLLRLANQSEWPPGVEALGSGIALILLLACTIQLTSPHRATLLQLGQCSVAALAICIGQSDGRFAALVLLVLIILTRSAARVGGGLAATLAMAGLGGLPPLGAFPGIVLVIMALSSSEPWLLLPLGAATIALISVSVPRHPVAFHPKLAIPSVGWLPLGLALLVGFCSPEGLVRWWHILTAGGP